jgi:hypothetical protein
VAIPQSGSSKVLHFPAQLRTSQGNPVVRAVGRRGSCRVTGSGASPRAARAANGFRYVVLALAGTARHTGAGGTCTGPIVQTSAALKRPRGRSEPRSGGQRMAASLTLRYRGDRLVRWRWCAGLSRMRLRVMNTAYRADRLEWVGAPRWPTRRWPKYLVIVRIDSARWRLVALRPRMFLRVRHTAVGSDHPQKFRATGALCRLRPAPPSSAIQERPQ